MSNYCSLDLQFTPALNACLGYALKYHMWKDYSEQVVVAASACGDDATPSPALEPAIVVSTGSAAASTAVIPTASGTVSPTTTQLLPATPGTSGVVSSAISTVSVSLDPSWQQSLTNIGFHD